MRITVGHILILGVAGGAVAFAGLPSSEWIHHKMDGAKKEIKSLKNLFKSGEAETSSQPSAPPQTNSVPIRTAVPVAGSTSPLAIPAQNVVSIPKKAAPIAKSVGPVKKAVTKKRLNKKSKKKITRKTRKKRVTKKRSKKKAVVRKKKAAPHPLDKLMNSFVEVELKTGRVVRGVLQARTKTHYTVQLPGLGPFQYPLGEVKGITSAN